jgi:hypothetical protein
LATPSGFVAVWSAGDGDIGSSNRRFQPKFTPPPDRPCRHRGR